MVKPAADRIAKFNSKYDPLTVEARFTAAAEVAKDGFRVSASNAEAMERAVQAVCNADEIHTPNRPKYHNFGRELAKLIRDGVTDPALTAHAVVLAGKYVAWGCLEDTIIKIGLNVFSVIIPPA